MAVEKVTGSTPAYPIYYDGKTTSSEDYIPKPSRNSREDDILEEDFTASKPKQKRDLFVPLLIVFVIAGAILLFI